MSEIADFLRARYQERRQQENAKRCRIPSVFDDHDVEFRYTVDEGEQLFVDGRPFPADQFWATASEPAPDPDVIADLDAKLAVVTVYENAERARAVAVPGTQTHDLMTGAANTMRRAMYLLARPFAGRPDHKGEEWAS